MTALDTARTAVMWPLRQGVGFIRNVVYWVTRNLHLRDVLLPAVYSSLVWLSNQVPLALGGGRAGEQVEASIVLSVATFLTGFVTGGLAWALIAVWVVTALLGLLRFVPAVGRRWPVPRWSLGDAGSVGVL